MLKTNIAASISAALTGQADFDTPGYKPAVARGIALSNTQADLVFADERTLAASATENLDLAGTLQNAFGQTITFARVKAIIITAPAANPGDILVGGAGSNAFLGPLNANTSSVAIRPGGVALFACNDITGWPVTAGTGDLLKVTNGSGAGAGTYDIMIVGLST